MTERQPTASPTEQALERYAHFLQRTKEMGVVGHRGGLKATGDLLQMCDLQAGQRILEVGCGSGYTACTTAKQHQASVAAVDLESEDLRRLFVNLCYWCIGREHVIPERNDATLVDPYEPSMFGFGDHKPGVRPEDLTVP